MGEKKIEGKPREKLERHERDGARRSKKLTSTASLLSSQSLREDSVAQTSVILSTETKDTVDSVDVVVGVCPGNAQH